MPEKIKGIVSTPIEMPAELRERGRSPATRAVDQVPLLIRLYTWYCFLRAFACLSFAFIEGLAPESPLAIFLASSLNSIPKQVSPEAYFFIFAGLYGLIGWRLLMRDWRARWAAMFFHGAIAARTIILIAADRAAGDPIIPSQLAEFLLLSSVINIIICLFLAFYPGMDQTFKETPWS